MKIVDNQSLMIDQSVPALVKIREAVKMDHTLTFSRSAQLPKSCSDK